MKRLLTCLSCLAACLYGYVGQQNAVTKKQLEIPRLTREIKVLQEENARLKVAIEQFESPEHLIALARQEAFAHLHFPCERGIVAAEKGLALAPAEERAEGESAVLPRTFVATLP